MGSRENYPTQGNYLRVAFVIAGLLITVIILLRPITSASNFLPPPTSTVFTTSTNIKPSPTTKPELSATPSISPSITSTFELTPSPTLPFPTPLMSALGTNIPERFRVGPWHDNYIPCDNSRRNHTVMIFGVEISGGTPPFRFAFWEFRTANRVFFSTDTILEKDYVVFEIPVVVNKGEYVHIVINFNMANGLEATWIDDLYYPYAEYNSNCAIP